MFVCNELSPIFVRINGLIIDGVKITKKIRVYFFQITYFIVNASEHYIII